MFPDTHASAKEWYAVAEMELGPNLPEVGAPEPASLVADGSEETLSDVADLEEDVRDYDLGEGD